MNQIVVKQQATISIGMPVYNGEKYIREALDSLLDQSFSDFELIISDNASSDSTQAICLKYVDRDLRVRYIRQSSNIGAAANFKFVLNQCIGTYFMWAAYDDKWSREWLEKAHDAIRESGVSMAFGQIVHVDSAGEVMKHPANGVSFGYAYGANSLLRRIRFYLAYEGMGKANCIYSLYDRRLLGPLNDMWSEIISGDRLYDYTMVYECLKYGNLKQVEKVTLSKRVHGESEGSGQQGSGVGGLSQLKKSKRLFWPFPPRLIAEYLRFSTALEKTALLLFIPLKLLVAYRFRLIQIIPMVGVAWLSAGYHDDN